MGHGIKVLRVVGGLDPAFGGPSESAVNQCLATQAAGVENTLVYPFHPEMSEENSLARRRLEDAGVVTMRFAISHPAGRQSYRWAVSLGASRWIMRRIRHFDLVHVHSAWGVAQLAALNTARFARRPCMMTPHESLTEFDIETSTSVPPRAKQAIRRHYLAHLASIVFSSAAEARDSLTPGARVRSVVIPHPVIGIVDEPPARRAGAERLTVGFLGRLHPKKNVHLLIQAMADMETAELVIAGDGPEAARLMQLADDCGVAPRVNWLGFVRGRARDAFFDSIDALALPSDYECFGMAVAEAMARGVPSIVSSDCGISEVLGRNRCGVIVDASVQSLTRAIAGLLDSHHREGLRKASLAGAKRELSLDAFGVAQRREYEAVLND